MSDGFFGWKGQTDGGSGFNAADFQIQQAIAQVRTAIAVKVTAVYGGGVGAPPTVDVQPLTNQTDGQGNQIAPGLICGLPVTRLQGGGNAIINDPIVGDVGYIVVADRDISAVKATAGGLSNPGSYRMHSLSDGVYIGAMLNAADPDQYVHFTETGITISDKNGNTIVTGPEGINLNGVTIDQDGNIKTAGSITAGDGTSDAVTLQHHTHPTAPAGPPSPPTPGT